MDVTFLVAEIEELGVRFRVERFHVGIEGLEQTVIAIDYPNVEIEDLVYEQIQTFRRRQVRSYLLTRPSGSLIFSPRASPRSRGASARKNLPKMPSRSPPWSGAFSSMRDSSSCCAASVAYVRGKRLLRSSRRVNRAARRRFPVAGSCGQRARIPPLVVDRESYSR
jgi:hypothetical protein